MTYDTLMLDADFPDITDDREPIYEPERLSVRVPVLDPCREAGRCVCGYCEDKLRDMQDDEPLWLGGE